METSQPLLVARDLECARDGRILFSALQLQVQQAEVISLQGANGAGKSTLLRCIAGLYPDFEGAVTAAHFVYSGHKPGFSGLLSTSENLTYLVELDRGRAEGEGEAEAEGAKTRMPLRGPDVSPLAASVDEALAAVGLLGYEAVRCASLSAGQLRRVGLARLLLSVAPLWLLDEPLTALDEAGSDLLGRILLKHLERGGGAICATHQRLPLTDYTSVQLTPSGVVSTTV